mgnify:CR=1 FL=1
MSFPVVFADTTTTVAWVILLASVLGWVIYGLGNLRSSKREIGAEIKLAANRKPYYDDERLEGEKIERTQLIGLAFLAVTTIALPLYWILEPGRMVGAEKEFEHIFEEWGSGLFATTADGGFNCAGCHGGICPIDVFQPMAGGCDRQQLRAGLGKQMARHLDARALGECGGAHPAAHQGGTGRLEGEDRAIC